MSSSDLDKSDSATERTALHWVAITKNHDCARALVDAGVSTAVRDKDGRTPLHIAVSESDRALIKLLIAAGAPLDIPDNTKQTPLDCTQDTGVLLYIKHCHQKVNSDSNKFLS